jgi:hypothetical protein
VSELSVLKYSFLIWEVSEICTTEQIHFIIYSEHVLLTLWTHQFDQWLFSLLLLNHI